MASPDVMHHSMSTVHAANICMWLKRDLKYDPIKEEFIERPRGQPLPHSRPAGAVDLLISPEPPARSTHHDPNDRSHASLACAALSRSVRRRLTHRTSRPPAKEQEAKLIAVLKSDAPLKDKADACRELSLVGTKESVAPLAALLGDEKLSHLARYGLEPIPDPAVDEALRDALRKLKGRPLVGVIGSIGVRRDAKAVEPLSGLLKDTDADVAQAAARRWAESAARPPPRPWRMPSTTAPAAKRPAVSEGLFRCAEHLVGTRSTTRLQALAIYDRLESPGRAAAGSREAAARKARFLRQEAGPTLVRIAGIPIPEDWRPFMTIDSTRSCSAWRVAAAGLGLPALHAQPRAALVPSAARRHAQAPAALARVQPAQQVHGRRPEAVRGARLRRHRRAGLRLRPAAAGLPLLDRPRATRASSRSRSSRRSTRRSSSATSTAFTSRSTSTGPRDSPSPSPPSRSRSGAIRRSWTSAPTTGRPSPRGIKACPNNRGQLQPVQRARRQGQAGGPPPRGRAGRRGDPRARPEAADRLRRPRLGHHAARRSCSA